MLPRSCLALALGATLASAAIAIACRSVTGAPIVDEDAADDAPSADAPSDGGGAPSDGGGAPSDASAGKDANGPGEAGAVCSFNRDCQIALRCECSEAAGCSCRPGARGAGQNGVSRCDGGNDCASAACIEGPPDSGFYCSDECQTPADCVAPLPECNSIAFLGRICVRTPPK